MDNKNFSDLGRQISDATQAAIKSGDFSKLNATIGSTMSVIVNQTTALGNAVKDSIAANKYGSSSRPIVVRAPKKTNALAPLERSGSFKMVAGIMLASVSSLGNFFFFITTIISLGVAISAPSFISLSVLALFSALFTTSVIGTFSGCKMYAKASRHKKYCAMLNGKNYCKISDMAAAVRKPCKFVVKELSQMLAENMIPAGHMDAQKTCIMLGDDTYAHYLETMNRARRQQLEESERRDNPESLSAVIAEGRSFLAQILDANRALPEENISAKLDELYSITGKIFAVVEKNPAKLPAIRRFLSYYLPTTVKLVNSYREFDSNTSGGENVLRAKQEILDVLDTINDSFKALLNGLYEEDTLDVSTDISALKTMLTGDGLSKSDFNNPK